MSPELDQPVDCPNGSKMIMNNTDNADNIKLKMKHIET